MSARAHSAQYPDRVDKNLRFLLPFVTARWHLSRAANNRGRHKKLRIVTNTSTCQRLAGLLEIRCAAQFHTHLMTFVIAAPLLSIEA